MPAAKGLFHKAIIQSGSDPQQGDPTEALVVRDRVLAALKLTPAEAGKLRDVPIADLVAASMRAGLLSYRPALDPVRMPANPFTTPLSADVPVLLGHTRDEATGLLVASPAWPKMTDADLDRQAAMILGGADKAAPLLAAYRARQPQEPPMYLWSYLMTDQMFTAKAAAMAERKAGLGRAPVFVYRVDWRSPVKDGLLRAPHGVEIPFVFDTVAVSPELVGSGGAQAAMTDLFIRTFSAFAHTGNPNAKGYPAWPAYTPATRQVFIYDERPKVISDPDPELRKLWAPAT